MVDKKVVPTWRTGCLGADMDKYICTNCKLLIYVNGVWAEKMKRKYKITFEVDAVYPYIHKEDENEEVAKDFDQWLLDWSDSSGAPKDIIPMLYNSEGKHQPNGTVRVKVERNDEVILNKWWDELSDDF